MREKLKPERPGGERGDSRQPAEAAKSHDAVGEGELEHGAIDAAQRPNDDSLGLPHALRQQQGAERRRNGESRDERPRDRKRVSLRHRSKYVPLDAGKSE